MNAPITGPSDRLYGKVIVLSTKRVTDSPSWSAWDRGPGDHRLTTPSPSHPRRDPYGERMFPTRRLLPLLVTIAVVGGACSSSGPERAAPVAPKASSSCPGPTAPAGRAEATVSSNGRERTYARYVPTGHARDRPAPLVVDLTAYSPASMEESFSGFTKPDAAGRVKADEVGAVVVTPEPVNGKGLLTWNVDHTTGWTDDQRFVTDLIKDVKSHTCIDGNRVFVMGFAIGGVMASTLACDTSDSITAIATVSGLWDPPDCTPSRTIPVLSIHGTGDHFLPYDGGVGDRIGKLGLSPETSAGLAAMAARPGATAASAAWAARNGCAPTPKDRTIAPGVRRTRWTGCDAPVELYTIAGGSHTWPGSIGMGGYTSLLGPASTAVNANDVIWDFFAARIRSWLSGSAPGCRRNHRRSPPIRSGGPHFGR